MVRYWTHPISLFNVKFLYSKARFILGELGHTRQHWNKDLNVYVRRFSENALDCCYLVSKEMLVSVCLHGMAEENMLFLENLSFLSFAKLMKAARRTNDSVRKLSRCSTSLRPS